MKLSTTLRGLMRTVKEKHFRIAESSGSLGIIGIIALAVVAVLLLWKPFLGGLSKYVAFALCVLVPLFNL